MSFQGKKGPRRQVVTAKHRASARKAIAKATKKREPILTPVLDWGKK